MGKNNFFFKEPVGILEEVNEPMTSFSQPVDARIKLAQNGYELNYEGKDFIAKNLDEALGLIRSWMEMNEKKMTKGEKEEKESDKDENTSHIG